MSEISAVFERYPYQKALIYAIIVTSDEPLSARDIHERSSGLRTLQTTRTHLSELKRRDDIVTTPDAGRPYNPTVYAHAGGDTS